MYCLSKNKRVETLSNNPFLFELERFSGEKDTRINTLYISKSKNGVINMVILVIKTKTPL